MLILTTETRPFVQAEIRIVRDFYYPETTLNYHIFEIFGSKRQPTNRGARVNIQFIAESLADFYPYLSTGSKRRLTNLAKGYGI